MIVSDQKNGILNGIDTLRSNAEESLATRVIALEEVQDHLQEKIDELEDEIDDAE